MRNCQNDSVLLKCPSQKATEKMKQELTAKMEEKYGVTETNMRKPPVRITNIDWLFELEELKASIRAQNESFAEEDLIDVKLLRTTRKGDRT